MGGLFLLLFGLLWMGLCVACGSFEGALVLIMIMGLGMAAIGIVLICQYFKNRRYLVFLRRSVAALCKDTDLFSSLQREYKATDLKWHRIGLGKQHLFLLGHPPFEYEMIERADYHIKEQQETSTGVIPESLGLYVWLNNGFCAELKCLKCPPVDWAMRETAILGRMKKTRISLQERVHGSSEYMGLLKEINNRAGQKSANRGTGAAFKAD